MSKKPQQALEFFTVKIQNKNEETSVQETGNNIRAQNVGLLDMIFPTCDNLSKTSEKINDHGQYERVVRIPVPVADSSSSREPLAG